MFATPPPGEDWSWLRQLQSQYHKWSSNSLAEWMIKSTVDDNNPPKAKHVRRLIIASLRDVSVTPLTVCTFMMKERPWRNDERISAKCLYVVLVLLQYRENLSSCLSIGQMTNQIVSYYTNKHSIEDKMKLYAEAAQKLGAIIHSKLLLHGKCPEVHGNFAVSQEYKTEELQNELRRHLNCIFYETNSYFQHISRSEVFAFTVLWQPMVEETINTYRLLNSYGRDKGSLSILKEVEFFTKNLQEHPFVTTTVDYPYENETVTAPRIRFPTKV